MSKRNKIIVGGAAALVLLWWWKSKSKPAAATVANAPSVPKPEPLGSVQLTSGYGIKYG